VSLPPGATLVSGQLPVALPPGATLVSGAPPAPKGMGAAALGEPEEISTGPEGTTPDERLMSPESRRSADKGMIAAGSMIPLAFVPSSWPLIGRVAAATAVGAAKGAAETGVEEHPTGRDMLKNMAEQGALYGGGELAGGLLQKAFGFLRSLRGVSQAAKATEAEAAAAAAATPKSVTPQPEVAPTPKPKLSDMSAGPKPPAPVPPKPKLSDMSAGPKPPAPVPPKPPAPAQLTQKPAGDIIGERLGVLDKDPKSLITSALKPGTNNSKWFSDVQRAMPDLKTAETELGHPIKTFDDAREAVRSAKANLWSQYQAKLTQAKQFAPDAPSVATIDGNQVADAMLKSIDARTASQNPTLVDRITKVANTYRREMPIDEAEEFLQSANNELNSYYAKNKVGQQVAARDPDTGHVVEEANALRKALYSKLDELTGPGAADLKQRYGALSNFEDVLSKRQNVALRQQPQSLAEQISKARAYAKIAVGTARMDPWAVYEGVQQSAAATWLKERQTSEAMMERAFANWGRPAAESAKPLHVPNIPSVRPISSVVASESQEQ
jgi:hypothetical protein